MRKYTQNEIDLYFKEYGYVIKDFYKNCYTKMVIEDIYGYKYFSSYNAFNNGIKRYGKKSELTRFGVDNPYTIQNIELWLKLTEKTFELSPNQKFIGTDMRLYFTCTTCGEENFQLQWNPLIFGGIKNCPYCSGHRIGKYNNLKYKFPNLCKEWDYKRNDDLFPEKLSPGSTLKVFWLCKNNHSFFSSIYARAMLKSDCPYCAGSLPTKNNNLYVLFPDLIDECWNWNKNIELGIDPHDTLPFSGKKAFWHCSICGSDNFVRIADIVSEKSHCRNCNFSNGEYKIQKFLNEKNINYIPQKKFDDCRDILPLMFDFYLFDFNICIEFQGLQHYVSQDYFGGEIAFLDRIKKDKIKKQYCLDNDIKFLEIPYWQIEEIESILNRELVLNFKGKEVVFGN